MSTADLLRMSHAQREVAAVALLTHLKQRFSRESDFVSACNRVRANKKFAMCILATQEDEDFVELIATPERSALEKMASFANKARSWLPGASRSPPPPSALVAAPSPSPSPSPAVPAPAAAATPTESSPPVTDESAWEEIELEEVEEEAPLIPSATCKPRSKQL